MPCHALPCPALPSPCPAIPLPCHPPVLPCPPFPMTCPALPCPAVPCPALPCPALPCPALHALAGRPALHARRVLQLGQLAKLSPGPSRIGQGADRARAGHGPPQLVDVHGGVGAATGPESERRHEGSPAAARDVRGRVPRGPGEKAGGGVRGVAGMRVAGGRRQVPPSWSLPHRAAAPPVSVAWFGAQLVLDTPSGA